MKMTNEFLVLKCGLQGFSEQDKKTYQMTKAMVKSFMKDNLLEEHEVEALLLLHQVRQVKVAKVMEQKWSIPARLWEDAVYFTHSWQKQGRATKTLPYHGPIVTDSKRYRLKMMKEWDKMFKFICSSNLLIPPQFAMKNAIASAWNKQKSWARSLFEKVKVSHNNTQHGKPQ